VALGTGPSDEDTCVLPLWVLGLRCPFPVPDTEMLLCR